MGESVAEQSALHVHTAVRFTEVPVALPATLAAAGGGGGWWASCVPGGDTPQKPGVGML